MSKAVYSLVAVITVPNDTAPNEQRSTLLRVKISTQIPCKILSLSRRTRFDCRANTTQVLRNDSSSQDELKSSFQCAVELWGGTISGTSSWYEIQCMAAAESLKEYQNVPAGSVAVPGTIPNLYYSQQLPCGQHGCVLRAVMRRFQLQKCSLKYVLGSGGCGWSHD